MIFLFLIIPFISTANVVKSQVIDIKACTTCELNNNIEDLKKITVINKCSNKIENLCKNIPKKKRKLCSKSSNIINKYETTASSKYETIARSCAVGISNETLSTVDLIVSLAKQLTVDHADTFKSIKTDVNNIVTQGTNIANDVMGALYDSPGLVLNILITEVRELSKTSENSLNEFIKDPKEFSKEFTQSVDEHTRYTNNLENDIKNEALQLSQTALKTSGEAIDKFMENPEENILQIEQEYNIATDSLKTQWDRFHTCFNDTAKIQFYCASGLQMTASILLFKLVLLKFAFMQIKAIKSIFTTYFALSKKHKLRTGHHTSISAKSSGEQENSETHVKKTLLKKKIKQLNKKPNLETKNTKQPKSTKNTNKKLNPETRYPIRLKKKPNLETKNTKQPKSTKNTKKTINPETQYPIRLKKKPNPETKKHKTIRN